MTTQFAPKLPADVDTNKLPKLIKEFEDIDNLNNSIDYVLPEAPSGIYNAGGEKYEFVYSTTPFTEEILNCNLTQIKEWAKKGINFTHSIAGYFEKEFKIEKAVAYNLSLLIPDIYRNPLTSLGIEENPHLGLYVWGLPGDCRDTIAKCLEKEWLYSGRLSMSGLDSSVGIYKCLSVLNKNILLLGTDIGTASKNLETWQKKNPVIITNFLWDAYDVRHTKSEGSVECRNEGASAFLGGNVPLGKEPFNVRDISRIIQREIPPLKDRRAELLYRAVLREVKLSTLQHSLWISYHVLCACIMQGSLNVGIFKGRRTYANIPPDIYKKMGAFVLKKYLGNVYEFYDDDKIFSEREKILKMLKEQEAVEDVNAILRILTMAEMIVMDSTIDNMLNRPYEVQGNDILVYSVEEDLKTLQVIMDNIFWQNKRDELQDEMKARKARETPIYLDPVKQFYEILKGMPDELFSPKETVWHGVKENSC